jgi:HSP20 family molecular chaperone IbpA
MPGFADGCFDRMFDEMSPASNVDCRRPPPSRIADGDLIVRADVPGFRPEEISIESGDADDRRQA